MKEISMQKIITILFITLSILLEPIYSQSGTYLKEAISAMEAGLFKEALKQLDIARVKEPNNAEVYKLKALLYEAINENNNAISAWSNCIKNTKDKNLIREAKIHLAHLKGY
jgi:tetratricopeptide (TPR) repeat protein